VTLRELSAGTALEVLLEAPRESLFAEMKRNDESQGRSLIVCVFWPALCHWRRRITSEVRPRDSVAEIASPLRRAWPTKSAEPELEEVQTVVRAVRLRKVCFWALLRRDIAPELASNPASVGGWRRERDSNPWYGFPYTRFPSVLLQPLGHLSVFRINNLRAVSIRLSHTSALLPSADAITFGFIELKRTDDGLRRKLCKTSQSRVIT
jgi:hypothetical protein